MILFTDRVRMPHGCRVTMKRQPKLLTTKSFDLRRMKG